MPETTVRYEIRYSVPGTNFPVNKPDKANLYHDYNDVNVARQQLIVCRQGNAHHDFRIIEIITTKSVLDE